MEHPEVVGHYIAESNFEFSIVEEEGQLLLVQPAIPDEYHPTLRWNSPTQLMVENGPIAGAHIDLDIKGGVAVGGTAFGALPISRTEDPPQPTPGEGLLPPQYPEDSDRDAAFAAAWAAHEKGTQLTVPPPYEIHEMVMWLMAKDEFIFHGSKKIDIDVFEPRRDSLELLNYAGHGNLGAVYGTQDGLWAMFFAVVDRARLWGSIRNGFGTYVSRYTGEEINLYQFSVSAESLPDQPFSQGALYVLPRATFQRIKRGKDGPYTNEWGSPVPVEPLARILVEPEDFPFFDRVGGHDDSEIIRLQKAAEHVYSNVTAARRLDDGYSLTLSEDVDSGQLADWLELGRKFFPDMTREVMDDGVVELRGPEALVHTLEDRFAGHIDG